ncbi:MAG: polysaccharide deacetylase family protein, partial [Elusimicrobia bacterium]|nr:polysaccharide deacetylase family protein [Elusimicrobiota bacterium]
HKAAFAFLLDDAVSHHELEEAIRLLEARLVSLKPADGALVFRLVEFYQKTGRPELVEPLLDRYLAAAPRSQYAWLTKALLDMSAGRLRAAARATRKAEESNPANWEVPQLRAEIARRQGYAAEAARLSARSLALNPTNPADVFSHAQFLYGSRQTAKAKALVDDWLKRNEGPVLPILLYHGLTTNPNDPMLAYPYHHEVRVYEDHLRALKEAGYVSVTADRVGAWLRGEKDLPPRAVFITFDDARADSFRLGDPALRKFGFKAAMMAALVNVEGRPHPPPGFLSWSRMKEFQDGGRWEIQSHGDLAHIRVPTAPDGGQGLFLVNRQWRASDDRLETEGEWKDRLEGDYKSSREKIERRLGRTPTAYAFPEGAFGQKDDATNSPDAYGVNRALVGKYFKTAFVQDSRGLNTRGRDPLRMARIEPSNAWSGEDLLRHFRDKNPILEAYALKFDWAVEEGRYREAFALLAKLGSSGMTDSALIAKEAELRLSAGDYVRGRALAEQAGESGRTPRLERRLKTAAAEDRLDWEPGYWYQSDNQGRRTWSFSQTLSLPSSGAVRFFVGHRRAEAMERGFPTIVDDGIGGGADLRFGLAHGLRIEAVQDFLSGPAPDHLSASAHLSSRWGDELSSRAG